MKNPKELNDYLLHSGINAVVCSSNSSTPDYRALALMTGTGKVVSISVLETRLGGKSESCFKTKSFRNEIWVGGKYES